MIKALSCAVAALALGTASAVVTLQSGVPARGSTGVGQYDYFRLDVPNGRTNFSVTVSPLTGDPDLYVSCAPNMPTATSYLWASRRSGGDNVDVPHTDPNACTTAFMIGVFGFSNTTYVIEGTVKRGETFSWLQPAVPLVDTVEQGTSVFYAAFAPEKADMRIILTPKSGDPDLLVSCEPFPTVSTARWSSRTTDVDEVAVSGTDPNACNGTWHIAVLGFSSANYSIVFVTEPGAAEFLLDSIPTRRAVQAGQFVYFEFASGKVSNGVVMVNVQPLSGDPDLYMTCTGFPTISQYQWHSSHGPGKNDTVLVDYRDVNSCVHTSGSFKIGVHGFQYSVFEITASMQLAPNKALRA